jgi:hypothetical protein
MSPASLLVFKKTAPRKTRKNHLGIGSGLTLDEMTFLVMTGASNTDCGPGRLRRLHGPGCTAAVEALRASAPETLG